jgi:hypothetical protein
MHRVLSKILSMVDLHAIALYIKLYDLNRLPTASIYIYIYHISLV